MSNEMSDRENARTILGMSDSSIEKTLSRKERLVQLLFEQITPNGKIIGISPRNYASSVFPIDTIEYLRTENGKIFGPFIDGGYPIVLCCRDDEDSLRELAESLATRCSP